MKIVQDLELEISKCEFDPVQRACFRIAGRSLGLLAYRLRDHVDSQYVQLEDTFRSLLICSSQLNGSNPVLSSVANQYLKKLQRHLQDNRLMICFRAGLESTLPRTKAQRMEILRRCAQSSFDNSINFASELSDIPAPANYTDRMVAVDELKNETWNYLKKDLSDVIGIYRTKRGVGTLPPALNPNHSLYRSWLLLKERLQARSETWNVWIEWYEFRFLGKTSSKVPNGLWKSIENKLCLRHDFMSSDDVTTINGIFAEQILEEVEALVDYQASVEFSQTAPSVTVSNGTIEISDPPTARLSGQNHIAFSELQDALNAMKAECDKNSASHLKDDIDSYDNSFGSTGWENPIPFAIRGDRLRRLLDIHLAKDAGSDIPDISDQTLFCFQNLVRAHNFAVSIHPDTRKIDDQLNEGLRGLDSDPLEIFREISRIYQAKVVIDKNSRETLDFLRKGIDADSDSASKVLLAFGFIGNVVQSASGWIWRNRKALAAGSVTLGGALLATAKWMLAQEAWLLANFSVNSQIGALLRSVLEILKSLPI